MEQALKKALEWGYTGSGAIRANVELGRGEQEITKVVIQSHIKSKLFLLDPFFWVALGKALGWVNGDVQIQKVKDHGVGHDPRYTAETHTERRESYLFHWHRFIDHIAEGKDIESFFNDLLK